MDNTIVKTNFLGVTIDTEHGPKEDTRIVTALDKSFRLLDIIQFIEITKFKLNMVMFDYFWQVVIGTVTGLHVSTRVLKWFGYEGEYKKQKDAFLRILKRNDIAYRELNQTSKEIELYPTIKEELQLVPSNVTNSKFLIIKMAITRAKPANEPAKRASAT